MKGGIALDMLSEPPRPDVTQTDHFVAEFSYGGIPHAEAEKNMRLFADKILPVLQQDAAFATPQPPTLATLQSAAKSDLFAPA